MHGDDLKKKLKAHAAWLRGEGGCKANLSGANLSGADLRDANLCGANLCGAYLRGADLCDANLSYANLSGADLRDANLSGADLRDANLCGANLRRADLRRADLRLADLSYADLRRADLCDANLSYANLRGANLRDANLCYADLCDANLCYADLCDADLRGAILPAFQVPQEGELIVYKKAEGKVVKLRVPPEAKRTASLVGRKCRAEYVEVLYHEGDTAPISDRGDLVYAMGSVVYPDSYDDDPRIECTHGIHFWLTREEAEAW